MIYFIVDEKQDGTQQILQDIVLAEDILSLADIDDIRNVDLTGTSPALANNHVLNYNGTNWVHTNDVLLGNITASTMLTTIDSGLTIGSTVMSASASELNILDGATVSTAEINYLDITTLGTSEASKVLTANASGDVIVPDSDKFQFGSGLDMTLYHDGTDSYITNATGTLNIATETSGVPVVIGHTTSEVTVSDNLNVTGISTFNDNVVLDNAKSLVLSELDSNGSNTVSIKAPDSVTSDVILTLSENTGTVVSTGDTGSVTNTMLAGSITASKMNNAIFEDLEALGAASSDGEFIVATGAGAFAYESGNTARTSLGLGTGNSPTFTSLTLSGQASSLAMNSQKITGLATPTADGDAATKSYVDSVAQGLSAKDSVRVSTTANGTLASAYANGQTVDDIVLATGDRILLKDQSTGSENGIYTVNASGAPTRAVDFDSNAEVEKGAFIFVEEGTTNADTGFVLTTDGSITLGTTSLAFTQFSGAGQVTAGNALTKTGTTLDVNVDNSSIEISSDALRVKSGGITSAMLAGSIANSKLNQLTTANKVALTSLDLDGGTDIGADLVDADLIVVDDGAGGTNRKSALSRIKKYVYSAISGDATASDAGALTIASGAIETSMLNANVITGQTAETSVANDDLVLIYDTSESALRKMTKANFVSGLSSGLSNIVEDTTPQLGGSLDVNSQDIITTSNGNITLTPNGTGVVRIDGTSGIDLQSGEISVKNSGSVSNIKLYCESSNAHYTQIQSAAHSAYSGNVTLTLPVTTGTLICSGDSGTVTNAMLNSSVITGQTAETSIDDADLVLIYDDSASALRKMTKANFVSGLGGGSTAADDISAGDAAVNITTTSGNITIDAQGNDSDIIFKGTDNNVDTVFLTLDGSSNGDALFNGSIRFQNNYNRIHFGASSEVDLQYYSGYGLILNMLSASEGNEDPRFSINTASANNPSGPGLAFNHTGSDANNDKVGTIYFRGATSDSSSMFGAIDYGKIYCQILDRTAATRSSKILSSIYSNGTTATALESYGNSSDSNVTTKIYKNVDVADHDGTTGFRLSGTLVTSTAAELNIMDGDTSATSTTLVDADRVVVNDAGTMKQVAMTDVMTYVNANVSGGGGGGGFTYSAITSTTTAQASYHYSVDTSGGAVTLNLPARSGITAGTEIRVKLTAAGNDLTIDGNSTETIDGSETLVLNVANQSVTLVAGSSTNWEII
jgi:hypothetical protein